MDRDRMRRRLRHAGDRGASLVEYALLIALIAMVCVLAVTFLGSTTSAEYNDNTSSLFL